MAIAKTIGRGAIERTISGVIAPFTDRPRNTSAFCHGLGQSAKISIDGETLFVRIHSLGAALVDHTFGVAEDDILALHAQADVVLGASKARGSRAVHDDANFANILAGNFQSIEQRRAGNDCRTVLIIMKDRDLHRLLQSLFDVETFRRLDVFQVDSAERGLEQLADFDDLIGIVSIDFDVEDIHAGKTFEQDGLAFHDRLAGERADVAQAEHCGAIGDHRHQIAAAVYL